MRGFWAVPLVIGVLSGAAGAVSPQPERVIPLSLYVGRLTAMEATVNGRTGTYFFDTGGGMTVISPETAKAGGCEPWGNIAVIRMNGERLDGPHCENVTVSTPAGPVTVSTALVLDINSLLDKGMPPVEGMIALDAFAGKTVTLESAAQRLIIESPDSFKARIAQAREIPIRVVRDGQGLALTYDVGVPTPKGLAWMEIDSGNISGTVMISTWMAPLFKLDADKREVQTLDAEVLPGVKLPSKARVIPNMIMDGLLGADFLKEWNLTIDQKAQRAWISPAQ